MEKNRFNWNIGEIVKLPWESKVVSKRGLTAYEHLVNSRYVCIRETNGNERGILLKVLGKINSEPITMVKGEPFCKDDKREGLYGDSYYSHPFPKLSELKEVLDIIRNNKNLIDKFEEASMHINPNSTFWVSDCARRFLVMKEPQFYDATYGELFTSGNDKDIHYRVSIVYFYKSKLYW